MLKEIYAIPNSEKRYKDNVMELSNELDVIIQQVDMLLFTNQGDVLLLPDFGCNLEKYLFETSYNETVIKSVILNQIRKYIYLTGTYSVDVDVSFIKWDYNVAMVVDLTIDSKKVASYLV
jgi:hypothetical protein